MIAPLYDLPVRRLFRSLSLSVPWRGGSNGSGTDTATIATGAGAKSDSTHDNFAAAAPPLSFELQTWPIPPPSSSSTASTTTIPRTITPLPEDTEASRGSFESSRSRSSTISTISTFSGGDDQAPLKHPEERQRACENCWKEFWG
ncbi:hypothetical protein PG994_004817 [Apiospora phragmitis]|uniref:Uncharacterized protein n=1 Tax=Apiospora phragmitis TaxID=2905665 RepID=A0ABR1VRP1_9PEZI